MGYSKDFVYLPGQIITTTELDKRWYKQLKNFLLGRSPPLIQRTYRCIK